MIQEDAIPVQADRGSEEVRGFGHELFDSGHVPPFTGVAGERIGWPDRVLGPVAPGPP